MVEYTQDEYDEFSAFWAFRSISALANVNNQEFKTEIRNNWDNFENQLIWNQPFIDKMLTKMYRKNKTKALKFANLYSNSLALYLVNYAKKLRRNLITNITKSTEKNYDPVLLKKKF